MNLNESKILLENMYDALNAQDLEAQHKYWHDNMVWHGPPGFGAVSYTHLTLPTILLV